MSKYSRRHYEDVAKLLAEYRLAGWGYASEESQIKADTAKEIAEDFATLFATDNPLFNTEKFMKAATAGKR